MVERTKRPVFGYKFKNESLFQLAVTHRSVSAQNNERLEFLGDSLLGFIISSEIINLLPLANEGELTRTRASLVNGNNLAEIARLHDIGSLLILGEGEKKTGGWRRSSILANTFESLIGAIYLDSDFDTIKRIVTEIFSTSLNKLESNHVPKDHKTTLQEYLQSLGLNLPEYRTLQISGSDHAKIFTVECKTELNLGSQKANGTSKRKAEQAAAEELLKQLGLV